MSAKTTKESAMETWVYTETAELVAESMPSDAALGLSEHIRPPTIALSPDSFNLECFNEASDILLGC
jgi:hypothetical protein